MRRCAFILLSFVLGCGDGGEAAIHIAGEPLLLVSEDESRTVQVSVLDAPSSGACTPPLDPAAFVLSSSTDANQLFDRFELTANQGALALAISPRCDLIAPTGPDVLVEVEIASVDGCAKIATARLQISASPSDACAPAVQAWTGDCSAVPSDTTAAVMLAASDTPGSVCIRFESRDSVGELLSITSTSTVPLTVLDPASLPRGEGLGQPVIFELPFADTTHITGTFAVDYHIARNRAVDVQNSDFNGSVQITLGDAPLAIEVPVIPVDVPEFSVVRFPVVLRASEAGQALCGRATRVPPPGSQRSRLKPDLRLENPLTQRVQDQPEDFVCGESFQLAVSPAIGAVATEEIVIEAAVCSGCDGTPVPTATPFSRTIALSTLSRAEEISCPTNDGSANVAVACADLAGDASPELLFRSTGGSNPRSCAFLNQAGRLSQVPFAAGSTLVPRTIAALSWRDPIAGPTAIVLGQFTSGAPTRRLLVNATTAEASWVAAAELGIEGLSIDLDSAVGLAADLNAGVTHLARIDSAGTGVVLECVAPSDVGIPSCQSVALANLVGGTNRIRDLGAADIDGNGDVDLFAFAGNGTGVAQLAVVAVGLDWSAVGAPTMIDSTIELTGLLARRVSAIGLDISGCTAAPCRQALFAVRGEAGHDTASVVHISLPGGGPLSGLQIGSEPTLGGTRGLTRVDGQPVVGTAYGVSQAINVGQGGTAWTLRDPVLIESQLFVPPVEQPATYGRRLSACIGSAGGFAFSTNAAGARVVHSNVVVDAY